MPGSGWEPPVRSRYTILVVAALTLAIGAVAAIGAGSFYSAAEETSPVVRHLSLIHI